MKNFFMLVFAILFTILSVTVMHFMQKDLLFKDAVRYTFYSQSASSQANIVTASGQNARAVKKSITNLTGESAEYENAAMALKQIKKYNATFKFMEKNADIENYYFYSPQLYNAISINGRAINLHIAVKANAVGVGSPFIFGGF